MDDVAVARLDEIEPGGMRQVEVAGVEVLLARVGDEVFATGARCAHYGAPLAEGVLHGTRVTCPWHHAVYDVATGLQQEPPGCGGLQRFAARVVDGEVRVAVPEGATGRADPPFATPDPARDSRLFVIVGAGAAGQSAAETLRSDGFRGRVVLVGREDRLPYDRTLLSKEFLKGADLPSPVELRPADFYDRLGIELRLGREVRRVDPAARLVEFADGERLAYDACLLATGGRPRPLEAPGADLPGVLLLRSRDDAEALLSAVGQARNVVVVGSSFIAMEGAASLTERGLAVIVVTPEEVPFAKLFGEEVGRAILGAHQAKGTRFRLGRQVARFEGDGRLEAVVTDQGERILADLALVGIGIAPVTDYLEGVKLGKDGGVAVDARMAVTDGLYAAGDIARFTVPHTGATARIEHWRLACEHGRVAALAMLGRETRYEGVPFFWSAQHMALYYVGHARGFDEVVLDGDPREGAFVAYYVEDGRVTAALGSQRNAEMAAIQELMRLRAMPDAARVRGGFDPVARLRSIA